MKGPLKVSRILIHQPLQDLEILIEKRMWNRDEES